MRVNIGNNFIVAEGSWPEIRDITVSKSLAMQYAYETTSPSQSPQYTIFSVDNPVVYQTIIWDGTVPLGASVDQSANDAYKLDFLTN